ncbi:MAG: hypothetical protein CME68_08220 [Halobacteriovoraceae bacterium]|nr:hypothetical protein [Halobacteriovoraceae bacterium]
MSFWHNNWSYIMAKYIQSLALLRNCLFVGLLLTLLIDSEKASAQFQELKSEKVTPVTFTADIFQSGGSPLKKFIALTFQNEKKWHTYWKNPGDAGIPLSFEFFSNEEKIDLKALEWPYPKRFIEKGDMLAYGYDDRYTFFFPLNDDTIKKLKGKNLTIKSKWLVCKDICIPGQDVFKGRFDNNLNLTKNSKKVSISQGALNEAFLGLPKKIPFPKNLVLNLHKKKNSNELYLAYYFKQKAGGSSSLEVPRNNNILTPFPQSPFDFHKEEVISKDQATQIKMKVQWDGEYMEPPVDFPKNSVFEKPYLLRFLYHNAKGPVGIVEKSFSGFLPSSEDLKPEKKVALNKSSEKTEKNITSPYASAKSKKTQDLTNVVKPKKENLLLTFFFALLGGFILNFMPCVFPVISLKLFSLLKQKEMSQLSIMKHNAVYSFGILFSFLVLSFIVLILKSSGEQVGWGFHLQSPSFLSIMILFLFVLSLNLFGLYEIRTPGGKVIGNIDIDNSYRSDFISGVLATILSTPCSAPFLEVALTFAFTSSFPVTLLIFLSVGLGLSLPFLFVGIFPSMLKLLPKPGTWMEHFKKFLGLSLLLTSLWLFDVFQTIVTGPMSSTILILTLILTFFAFYSLKHMKLNKIGNLILILIPFLSVLYLVGIQLNNSKDINSSSTAVQKTANHPSNWEVWAPEKMNYYKKEGKAVFVDFTAKWCFTCIVNEKLVLQTKEFAKLMKDRSIKPLIADWTKRDPIIGNWLKEQGVFGLPAYFIQTSEGKLIHLGETISIKEIKNHL